MKVRFTRTARASLREIAFFIASDNPARALSFTLELEQRANELADMPALFALDSVRGHGVRRRIYGAYLILFRVEADGIIILDVRHGARAT